MVTRGLLAGALLFSAAAIARAQDTQAPAHISVADGSATVERDGQSQSAIPGLPIVPGDRLLTTRGRLEVLFPDGSALDLDEFTSMDVQSSTLLRLNSGRMMFIVAGASDPTNAVPYQIDTPAASAFTEGPGEYRVALFSGPNGVETELAVFRGSASLSTEQGTTRARAGERTLARDLSAPSYAVPFNSARFDAFDRWSMARRDARMGTQSAQYLPPSLSMYSGTFDRYGRWSYEPSYGYVWYPAVAADWRPYYLGYWSPIRSYGWTWIGFDIWGWPTYHYGRWGYVSNRWFWMPGRQWSPAWVHWAYSPGYVGWCPLGFNGAPVAAFSIFGNSRPGWTFLNAQHFGGPLHVVHHYAVTTTSIPANTPFIQQSRPPIAVPRPGTVPANGTTRSAGRAIPRPAAGAAAAQSPVFGQPSTIEGQTPARSSAIESRRTPAPTQGVPAYRQPQAQPRADQAPAGITRQAPFGAAQGRPFGAAPGRPAYAAPSRTPPPTSYTLPPRSAPADPAQGRPSYAVPSRTAPPASYPAAPRSAAPPPMSTAPFGMPSRGAPSFDSAPGRPMSAPPSMSIPRSAPPMSAPPSMSVPSRSAPAMPAPPSMGMPSRSAPPAMSAPPPGRPMMSAPPPMGGPSRAVPAPSAAPPPAAAPAAAPAGARAPRSR
jgi:uncharacterized protein DUF6600/FecR-like protein